MRGEGLVGRLAALVEPEGCRGPIPVDARPLDAYPKRTIGHQVFVAGQ